VIWKAWKYRVIGILLVVSSLASVYGYYRCGNLVLKWDALALFSPYYTLISDYARAGQFLLWNPWSNCGSPDMGYVELGSFSPLTIVMAALTGGGDSGFLMYWLLIWSIGGGGMVLLAHHLKAPVWGMMAVTLSFMFCGFYLGHATHTSWLYGFSFLPLMIWRLDVALSKHAAWPALEAGAFYGLSALAGHPAFIILNGLYLGCWAVGRWAFTPDLLCQSTCPSRRRGLANMIGKLALLLLAALVVLSPAYVAFFCRMCRLFRTVRASTTRLCHF